jgi:predicted DNA-binding transcriptional regulator AlpA
LASIISQEPIAVTDEIKFIMKPEVTNKVGVSYQTLWTWMQQGKFPRSRELAGGKIGWVLSEVNEWILNRPVVRLKDDPPVRSANARR